jgi:hypothetical protein
MHLYALVMGARWKHLLEGAHEGEGVSPSGTLAFCSIFMQYWLGLDQHDTSRHSVGALP